MRFKKIVLIVLLLSAAAFSYKFEDNRLYYPALIKLIDNAKQSILISQLEYNWSWTIENITRHLLRAQKRGVTVKILLENKYSKNKKIIKRLKFFGFDAELDSPDRLNHNKLVIVDSRFVLLGSTNFSYMSMMKNNETDILINDTHIAQIFSQYFERNFDNISTDSFRFKVRNDTITPIFDKTYFYIVKNELSKAQKRIYIILYGANYRSRYVKQLFSLLMQKAEQGVKISFMLENSDWDHGLTRLNERALSKLDDYGIKTYMDSPDTITHSKVIIVDNEVIIGSSNWGTGPFFKDTSTSVLIKDKRAVKHYISYFKSIYSTPY